MPRDFLFTKDEIIKVALDLTREKGFASVSARALGERLGTSSRPVFSHFNNMAEVQKAIIESANALYQQYRKEETASGIYVPYKASGMAYVRFAKEEKELFKLLFMRDRSQEFIKENPEEMGALMAMISKQVGIDEEEAKTFYFEMWAFTHGIASMIATNYLEWNESFVSMTLTDAYEGLKRRYENGGKRND